MSIKSQPVHIPFAYEVPGLLKQLPAEAFKDYEGLEKMGYIGRQSVYFGPGNIALPAYPESTPKKSHDEDTFAGSLMTDHRASRKLRPENLGLEPAKEGCHNAIIYLASLSDCKVIHPTGYVKFGASGGFNNRAPAYGTNGLDAVSILWKFDCGNLDHFSVERFFKKAFAPFRVHKDETSELFILDYCMVQDICQIHTPAQLFRYANVMKNKTEEVMNLYNYLYETLVEGNVHVEEVNRKIDISATTTQE